MSERRYVFLVVHTADRRYSGGGVLRAAQYWSEGWRARGMAPQMRIVPARGSGRLWWSPFVLLVCLVRMMVGRLLGRIALVHVNIAARGSTWRKLFVVAMARLLRLPLILHLHAHDYPGFFLAVPAMGQWVIRWMFQTADRVIVLGGGWRSYVVDQLGVARERVEILHNAVPDPLPGGELPKRDSAVPQICFLGILGDRKGVPTLLRALAHPVVHAHAYGAVIAGNGDVDHYRSMAADLDLSDRVSFPGWIHAPDAASLYSRSDIFVLPSRAEGLSSSLIEAMAYGLAIVTTPVGAHGEVIASGDNGLLVPVDDVEALAVSLDQLLANPAKRVELGRRARESFLAQFELEAFLDRLEAIYLSVQAPR